MFLEDPFLDEELAHERTITDKGESTTKYVVIFTCRLRLYTVMLYYSNK